MARTYEKEREHKWRSRGIVGMTYAQYEEMRLAQGERCAICGCHVNGNGRLDHDHETGRPRGILCNVHNLALGHLEQYILSGHVDAYLQLWHEEEVR